MNGGGVECKECRDGTIECGEDPCKGGGGGGAVWRFQGTAWMPIEGGIDASIKVYTRLEFARRNGRIVINPKTKEPEHRLTVRLEVPFRKHCVRTEECPSE